jgi:hypothetical protein
MEEEMVKVVTGRCMICGQDGTVKMPKDAYERWVGGMLIQRAWPEGTPGQREQLATGTHGDCFDKAFPPEKE